MAGDRIDKLSERFQRHAAGRPRSRTRSRIPKSFYLDEELFSQLDRAYRDVNHQLHPESVSKSVFLEALIEYGLDNLEAIKAAARAAQEQQGSSTSK